VSTDIIKGAIMTKDKNGIPLSTSDTLLRTIIMIETLRNNEMVRGYEEKSKRKNAYKAVKAYNSTIITLRTEYNQMNKDQ
tara:strand:+ start:497 stop:736 length:240 start_codon:yes stop_codon:yes gene_type:complete